jgi:hypothetical protein
MNQASVGKKKWLRDRTVGDKKKMVLEKRKRWLFQRDESSSVCELWSCILSICRRDFPTLVRCTASKEHLSGRQFPALRGRSSDAIDCNLGRPSLPISCYCSPLVAMFLGFAQPWLNFCSARARIDKPQNQWNMVRSGACQAASCFFVCTRIAKLSKPLRKASRHQILHQVSVGASCMIWLNIGEKKKKKTKYCARFDKQIWTRIPPNLREFKVCDYTIKFTWSYKLFYSLILFWVGKFYK